MDGRLLRFAENHAGAPEPPFWQLFAAIRQDLDRLYWCFSNQPWMGAPDDFLEDESATLCFDGQEIGNVQLWQPGVLGRYADRFAEEFIEIFGIEAETDNPQEVAALYNRSPCNELNTIIERHGQIWLIYTDSTCWEIYTQKTSLLEQLGTALQA